MKKYYSFSVAILTAATIFSLMGGNNVLADNYSNNYVTTNSDATPANITSVWTKGVTPPTNFVEDKDGLHASYVANQGWYDITKTFNGKDDLLCGGATAGNMLYWWLDQNKQEIETYLQKYPNKNGLIINGQELINLKDIINTKSDQKNSKLFNFFKEAAFSGYSRQRKGVMPDLVINMFINGYRLKLSDNKPTIAINELKDSRGGFFDEVFKRGEDSAILTERHNLVDNSLESISKLIRKSLDDGKALGLSHTYNSRYMGHVINLWGADFNPEGNLEAIYVTDSDSDASVGMKKYFVGVNSQGNVTISAKKIEGNNLGAQILGLFTLSTGQDIWNQNR